MNKQNASQSEQVVVLQVKTKKNLFNLLSLERGDHESNECREKVKFYKNKLTQGFL